MDQEGRENGYVIQLYQYARRYRYNNEECLKFFNYTLDRREKLGVERYTLESDFLAFGDFDLLEIISVETFREYHDLSELAKDWLGKRQSVLLYDISGKELPTRICYDEKNRLWKRIDTDRSPREISAKFFCFSLVPLTNEIVEGTKDNSGLLKTLRSKILSIVDELNHSGVCKLECEVFGAFNPSEVGIVWLSDQYVDVLQVMDYIKHMKVNGQGEYEGQKEYQAFLTSFSIIAIKEKTDAQGVSGKALVQVAMHDTMKNNSQIKDFAQEIIGDGEGNILGSVGEYDLVIEVPAKRAIKLIQNKGLLCVGERELGTGKFRIESSKVLRNNTKLLYDEEDTQELRGKLEELQMNGGFSITWPEDLKDFIHRFEWEELKISVDAEQDKCDEKSNADYFQEVRQKLKEIINSSAGAVDTLDLLYADYQSTISSAYSAMWVSDLHRQFKAVLYAIELLLTSDVLTWSWNDYRDLTNAFKQQIYHLAQSSKMFLEIPSCHLRATGQYDFLMHAYYGVTKKILETIYLIQGVDAQSELVPLITVNTVPQVRTQLYFELGEDDRRVINLDIPNSIIFDFQRGIWYLTHELFHYAVPLRRQTRNYYMAVFLLSWICKKQVFWILQELLTVDVDGLADDETKEAVERILSGEAAEGREADSDIAEMYKIVNMCVRKYILCHFNEVESFIGKKSKTDDLSNNYQRAIYEFVESNDSDEFFKGLFMEVCPQIFRLLLDGNAIGKQKDLEWIWDRVRYCQRKEGYVQQFVKTNSMKRKRNLVLSVYSKDAGEHWAAVREACSDIAMITLNGLDIIDYMLFCIQAWTDENNNKSKILSQMKNKSERKEWIRYSMVAEYMYPYSRGEEYAHKWNEIGKEFCKRYVWFYAGKSIKRPQEGQWEEVGGRYSSKYKEAKEWLAFLEQCRHTYLKEYSWYHGEILSKLISDFDIGQRIETLKTQDIDGHDEYIRRLESIVREFKEKVYLPYSKLYELIPAGFEDFFKESDLNSIKECNSLYNNARFRQDIAVANHFQNQKSLKELGILNQEVRKKCEKHSFSLDETKIEITDEENVSKKDTSCWEFHVRSLNELLFYIQYCFDQLVETAKKDKYVIGQRQNPRIWFRGHSSEKYTNIPTVMRDFKGDRVKNYQSLRDYQRSNFEEFKFRADGAAEMAAGLQFTQSDYIAMMQHYGAPTNFLDWTENAFTSLYLALKNHYKQDIKESDPKFRNVTLFIFHPGIYNRVRRDSLEAIRKKAESKKWIEEGLRRILDTENRYTNLIPNLSIRGNEECYDMFLLGDVRTEKKLDELEAALLKDYNESYDTEMKALYMPIAVLTSRLNPRIRTQCGCFVAYNLYTPQDLKAKEDENNKNSLFEYVSLEKIQEEKKDEAVFLYKIVIDKECCAEVVRWLRTLGVSRENVYPELSEKGYYFD